MSQQVRGCAGAATSEESDELGCLLAPPSTELNPDHSEPAPCEPEGFGVCPLFGFASHTQGSAGCEALVTANLVQGRDKRGVDGQLAPLQKGRPLAMTFMRRLDDGSAPGTGQGAGAAAPWCK